MRHILGLDGGNSKTTAVLADESGCVLGIGHSGNSNHQGVGIDRAIEEIRLAADQAAQQAGLKVQDPDCAYYALAGADLDEDFLLLQPGLQRLTFSSRRMMLDNDTIAAFRIGTDCPNAVVVVLGAGTNAAGRNDAGQQIRLPGLGWLSGDWGGGAEIARTAISLVVRAHDGRGSPTILSHMVLDLFHVLDVEALIRVFYSGTWHRDETIRRQFYNLSPLVFRAANLGDTVALDILMRSGAEVSTTAVALLRRLHLLDKPADVVLAGSVFQGEGDVLMEVIKGGLREAAPLARIVLPHAPPVLGAVYCAMDLLGLPVDETVRLRATESFERMAEEGANTR